MTLNERLFSAGLLATFDEAINAGDRAIVEDLLVQVETEPSLANALLVDSFQCWFCGLGIDRADGPALSIGLSNLWSNPAEIETTQSIYSHWHCAESKMTGASMKLAIDTFLSDGEAS